MIPPGYKQTEVGVIPEEWEVKTLGDLATIATGNTPPTSDPSNYGDEFPFVGPVDMGDNKFVSRTEKMLSRKGFAMSRRFPKDSILFVSIGSTIGKCGIAPVDLTSNQQINAIFPSPSFSVDFLFYAVSSAGPRIRAQAGEQAVPIVNKTQFSDTAVALPPLPEQRAIAAALSDVDALLAALDRLIAKQRDLKQAAMQQLLTGQTRLPGFEGEWETKRLGEVVDAMVGGGTPSRSNPLFWGDEIPWVTVKDFSTFNPRKSQESITKLGLKNSASHLIPAGTLITSTRMALGKAVVYDVDVAINQDLKALFLKPTADRLFVYYWFEANAKVIDDLGSGSTVKGISIAQLKSVPFPGTPLPEQTAIATVLSDMDLELAALEQRRDKTRALKQGMMQELLTGRTRLVASPQKGGGA